MQYLFGTGLINQIPVFKNFEFTNPIFPITGILSSEGFIYLISVEDKTNVRNKRVDDRCPIVQTVKNKF